MIATTRASRARILSLAGLPRQTLLLVAAGSLGVAGLILAIALVAGGFDGSLTVDGGLGLGSGAAASGAVSPGELVVDVTGAVLRPGVYHLPAGSRVGDAIAAAGGYSPRVAAGAASKQLNLAAPLHDGEQVDVPSRDDVGAGSTAGAVGAGGGGSGGRPTLVDLNTASESELDALPGIGPVTAAKIIAARADAPFTSVDQLLERKLVGQKTFDQIKSLVTVGG